MHIVTVATHSQYYFPYLVESCKRNGSELVVLGFGEKWLGFNWRYKKMVEYLSTLPKEEVVCFVDGYDVICTRNLNELEYEFYKIKQKNKCKMIVGHDKRISLNKIASLFFGQCKSKNLNSGTYIAMAGDMIDILQKIYDLNPEDNADDQIAMTNYCQQSNDLYIDEKNELFLTILHSLSDVNKHVTYENDLLTYQNQHPFFIHAPGYGYLDKIIEALGYGTCNIRKELYKNFYKKIILYILYIIKNYFLFFFLFFLFLYRKKIVRMIKIELKRKR